MRKSDFQFKRPILKNIEYSLSDSYDEEDEKIFFDNHMETRIARVSDNNNEATVELNITIGDKEKSVNIPFSLHITIGALFRWEKDMEESMVDSLLKINAPSLLLSYARPIISNITMNSAKPYDIPFIDFTDNTETQE